MVRRGVTHSLLGALLVLATLLTPVAAGAAPLVAEPATGTPSAATTTVTVGDNGRSVATAPPTAGLSGGRWEGFGINWNGVPYVSANGPVTSGRRGLGNPARWRVLPWHRDARQLQIDQERLVALHPAYVRMSWSINWFDPTYQVGAYRWNTTVMRDRYQDLSFLLAHNIPVITGMWAPPEGTVTYGSPQWVQMETALVSHLVKNWHFTNIKYWIGVNEPNGHICLHSHCEINFASWSAATTRLHQAFSDAGLLRQVQLMGPTVSSRFPWTPWKARRGTVHNWAKVLSRDPVLEKLGAVDWHQYLWTNKRGLPPKGTDALPILLNHHVRDSTASIVNDLHSGPYGEGKKTFITEYGFGNIARGNQQGGPSPFFSLAMLNYGIDLARSGVTGASMWELDPDIPGLRIAGDGLWQSRPPFTPYLLYQATSMLFHAVPAGSVVEPVDVAPHAGINVVAAKVPQGNSPRWSVLIVNNTATTRWVITRGLKGAGSLSQYDLSAAHHNRPITAQLAPDFIVPSHHGSATTEVAPHSATLMVG